MEDTEGVVGVVVAVREELAAVCGRLSPVAAAGHEPGVRAVRGVRRQHEGRLGGRPAVVAASGMGSVRAAHAAAALLDAHCVSALIIAGFAGALREGVSAGDLVIATAVHDATGPVPAACLAPDPGLLAVARHTAQHIGWCHAGAIVTRAAPERTPMRKRDLASAYPGAVAVDMETCAAARAAMDAGVPWIAVRAVTDAVDDSLPGWLDGCTDQDTGDVNRVKAAVRTLLQPWTLPALVALGVRSARAAGNLAAFIETLARATRQADPASLQSRPSNLP